MPAIINFITKPRRTGDHRPNLRGEQARAQETFNAKLRGYGNNNSQHTGRSIG